MANYRIILNEPVKDQSPHIYKFGNTDNITVNIGKGNGDIKFSVGKNYDIEAFINPKSYLFRIFRDTLRKAYLLHALRYDAGLSVRSITFCADEKKRTYSKEDDPRFPFIYSMIDEKTMGLSSGWKDKQFVQEAVSMTKTQADNDLRFAALASFLASFQKQYLIDSFSALWTSMNAYYNYIAKSFESWYEEKRATSEKNEKCLIKLYKNDSASIGALMSFYQDGVRKAPIKDTKKHFKEYIALQDFLRTLKKADLPELYSELEKSKQNSAYRLPEKYDIINKNAQELHYSAFNYMLFEIPYYWRCKYFHGDKSTTLFMAYSDPECSLLTVINYLLKMYLRAEIPQIFNATFFDDKFERILTHIETANNQGEKKKKTNVPDKSCSMRMLS